MKHTPGPWIIDKNDEYPGSYVIRQFFNLWNNDESTWDKDDPQSFIALCQEDEANAYLIASAPDLLKVCKLGAEIYHDSSTNLTCSEERPCLFCKAIAKAKGRE